MINLTAFFAEKTYINIDFMIKINIYRPAQKHKKKKNDIPQIIQVFLNRISIILESFFGIAYVFIFNHFLEKYIMFTQQMSIIHYYLYIIYYKIQILEDFFIIEKICVTISQFLENF
ncbi:hypothetical protein EDEG_03135 [Edhazardia aedis USNM 41457]|uniref:Transmembrane protein n=1 Tax=Edhazardia aedis (strain USNM 41457) TaxID=1003232 RepID=J9DM53_EDHAE|nr:hypothetical protein EDEG_03135 [Edhazardia aedis USNM 41457]|eukprot:EJW02462.1 hypothetical protein EDEG_03135 [Edhazardia aedis USNM 41457]